jgi:O-methyltransferase
VEQFPAWLATLHKIKVPLSVRPNAYESPAGSSNISIIFSLLEEALPLQGSVAECGVWQGSTLIPIGMFIRQHAPSKRLLGFDSFLGLDGAVCRDAALGGDEDARKTIGGFSNTSYEAVSTRVAQFDLADTITLVPGYFQNTLPRYPDLRYCFAHLDCVIHDSYRQTLQYFYPRMVPGGIILLDEYNDPTWPGCTQAVDSFMAGKPEHITEIKRDNHIKYYLRKY